MNALTRQQLTRSLQEGKIESLYLLIGEETYLRHEAAEAITAIASPNPALHEFNVSRLSLITNNALDVKKAAAECVTLSFDMFQPIMPGKKVVHVKDFGKVREKDEEVLVHLIENPFDSSVVIFVAADLDRRKKLTKTLFDKCTIVEFPLVGDGEAKAWAKNHLKQLKVSVDEMTLSDIVALVGTNIQTLSFELDKLATAAGGTGRIRIELVDELIGRSRELSNFDLTDHLISRNRKRALEILYRLLEDGSEPVMLIGLMASNYHRLALAKDLFTRKGKDAVFQVVRMPWRKQGEFLATLQRSSAADIARGIQRIAAADLAIKTSQATPRLQLEMLVCELSG